MHLRVQAKLSRPFGYPSRLRDNDLSYQDLLHRQYWPCILQLRTTVLVSCLLENDPAVPPSLPFVGE